MSGCRLLSSDGFPAHSLLNVLNTSCVPRVASFQIQTADTICRRRHLIDLQPGMRRPSGGLLNSFSHLLVLDHNLPEELGFRHRRLGGARLQNVAGRWHDLSWTVESPKSLRSMAEPGVWRGKRTDLFFSLSLDSFFASSGRKTQYKLEVAKTHPMSLPRPIPGSAMLRKLLGQASAEIK